MNMSKLSGMPICKRLGLSYPIFGFSHSVEVTAAICNAGGLGVYGATRDTPEQIVSQLNRFAIW